MATASEKKQAELVANVTTIVSSLVSLTAVKKIKDAAKAQMLNIASTYESAKMVITITCGLSITKEQDKVLKQWYIVRKPITKSKVANYSYDGIKSAITSLVLTADQKKELKALLK